MLCYRHKSNGCAPLFDIMKKLHTHDVKGGTPMKTNKLTILISAIAMIVLAVAAYFCKANAAVFDGCMLLLAYAGAALCYSVMHRAYKW